MSDNVIFKGYIPTDGKKPITKYTDPKNWLTKETVEGGDLTLVYWQIPPF